MPNSDGDGYSYANTFTYGFNKPERDPHGHTEYYSNSEPYAYSQANAHSPSQHNTEDTADPAATPIA